MRRLFRSATAMAALLALTSPAAAQMAPAPGTQPSPGAGAAAAGAGQLPLPDEMAPATGPDAPGSVTGQALDPSIPDLDTEGPGLAPGLPGPQVLPSPGLPQTAPPGSPQPGLGGTAAGQSNAPSGLGGPGLGTAGDPALGGPTDPTLGGIAPGVAPAESADDPDVAADPPADGDEDGGLGIEPAKLGTEEGASPADGADNGQPRPRRLPGEGTDEPGATSADGDPPPNIEPAD